MGRFFINNHKIIVVDNNCAGRKADSPPRRKGLEGARRKAGSGIFTTDEADWGGRNNWRKMLPKRRYFLKFQ